MAKLQLVVLPAIVGMVFVLWAFWWEPASVYNEVHDLRLAAWPSECSGLRVGVLSDLHVGSPYNGISKLEKIVSVTLAAEPDIILLAGDYVIHGVLGGRFTPPEEIAESLARLAAATPVYAVLGNHDAWFDGAQVRAALESAAIAVLEDASTVVQKGKCRFWLAGISDLWTGAHDLKSALRDVPESEPVVAFTHNPDIFPEIPSRVVLTVAGHTHGGQVYIPGIGRPITPSKYGQRYAIGHVVEGDRHLFVSSGLGTSILPVRFLVPPEVSVLTISSARIKS
jgi:predicted MPP superfamily phosphohydrolase